MIEIPEETHREHRRPDRDRQRGGCGGCNIGDQDSNQGVIRPNENCRGQFDRPGIVVEEFHFGTPFCKMEQAQDARPGRRGYDGQGRSTDGHHDGDQEGGSINQGHARF